MRVKTEGHPHSSCCGSGGQHPLHPLGYSTASHVRGRHCRRFDCSAHKRRWVSCGSKFCAFGKFGPFLSRRGTECCGPHSPAFREPQNTHAAGVSVLPLSKRRGGHRKICPVLGAELPHFSMLTPRIGPGFGKRSKVSPRGARPLTASLQTECCGPLSPAFREPGKFARFWGLNCPVSAC